MIYKKPLVVQIKPGIVVELTTEEAIKLIQELFRQVYGETPVPSNPPAPTIIPSQEYKPLYLVPMGEPKWPKTLFEITCGVTDEAQSTH